MQIEEVKRNLNRIVVYKDVPDTYRLTACILRRGEKGIFYQAELQDVKAKNSVLICRLEDIEEAQS